MSLSEFGIIEKYFSNCGSHRQDVILGVGDDAALLRPHANKILVSTVDTLVEGIHFFPDVDLESLGWKALSVSLSDLAAMGAVPAWATLAITLPDADSVRLEKFSQGFCQLAAQHDVQLVGGDTTRGPFSITVQLNGWLEEGRVMRRDAARLGDEIYVTGTLGDAAFGLRILQGTQKDDVSEDVEFLLERLHRPVARIEEGFYIAGFSQCAQDISDGLMADLGHICRASGVGARIEAQRIPLSKAVKSSMIEQEDWSAALSGGDDYELCFTLSAGRAAELKKHYPAEFAPIRYIGQIIAGDAVHCQLASDNTHLINTSYDHFS